MEVKVLQKITIRSIVEAVYIEWDCPVCETTNIFDEGEGDLQECGGCEFRLPEDVWSADDNFQEMLIDNTLIEEWRKQIDKEDEDEENEEDEDNDDGV